MAGITRLIGEAELKGKLTSELAAGPVRRLLQKSAITVRNDAVTHVAVDKGELRQGIVWEVDLAPMPTYARVGTNVGHGPDIEFGTSAHYVDPAVLEPWAARKGLGKNMGEAVSRHIAEHGTKAQPFLVPAFTRSQGAIQGFVVAAAKEIEALQK